MVGIVEFMYRLVVAVASKDHGFGVVAVLDMRQKLRLRYMPQAYATPTTWFGTATENFTFRQTAPRKGAIHLRR